MMYIAINTKTSLKIVLLITQKENEIGKLCLTYIAVNPMVTNVITFCNRHSRKESFSLRNVSRTVAETNQTLTKEQTNANKYAIETKTYDQYRLAQDVQDI